MPELPEVETIRRQLAPELAGRTITFAWGHDSAKFASAPLAIDARIDGVDRRGKYLILPLSTGADLVIHLGMTGKVRVGATTGTALDAPHVRAWWHLDDDHTMVFDDVRRFGRIAVTPRSDYRGLPTLHQIGPEPFDPELTDERFWRALRATSRHIKTDLLSQRPIAGVGNIYADEACWLAQVNPADRSITKARAAALLAALRTVLADGIEHGGTTLRDYVDAAGDRGGHQHHLRCYGRDGEPCERCSTLLRRTVLDARSTTWCPTCQPRRS